MLRTPLRWTVPAIGVHFAALVVVFGACGTAPTAFLVQGPGAFGNEPPSLTFIEPNSSFTVGQGSPFLIQWSDQDRDSNASIRFSLLNTATNGILVLADGIEENDQTGPDVLTVATSLIPVGTYNLFANISDEETSVDVFGLVDGGNGERLVLTVVGEAGGPVTSPPQVFVSEPLVNLSVAQDDTLTVVIRPVQQQPAVPVPYDVDSDITVYIVLDVDQNPNNDDPANPDPSKIIVVDTREIPEDATAEEEFRVEIDIARIPPRADGQPYFIRATVLDGNNPRVHRYAVGTINVTTLASDSVDLFEVGRTVAGTRFIGFNPGANSGSSVADGGDFDQDGVDDLLFAARFGNPQNLGPVGEAYLIYGLPDGARFGGSISLNSVSQSVSGVVFQAPPVRDFMVFSLSARTDGITDLTYVPDQTADGRPELLFALPHVHGAFDSTDYDPEDQPPQAPVPAAFCYPDFLVNNLATDVPGRDTGFYAGGMAVMVNSTNRDDEGFINLDRLESTAVSLELTGQLGTILDSAGVNANGSILPRADNSEVEGPALGNDPQEAGRIAGARFIGGGYDFTFQLEPPREDRFGQSVGFLGDVTSDTIPEIVISAPGNERYLNDLQNSPVAGLGYSPHFESTIFNASITIFPGGNYNLQDERDINDESGTSVTPFLDQHALEPFGSCTATPTVGRHYILPAEAFGLYAENMDDWLGDGQSAGDFNLDGLDDILCGAPRNDRSSSLKNSGAVYVIYTRTIFSDVLLRNVDDPILRTPMLRIRGNNLGDQIGNQQTAGLDVNGDRVDDVFLASATTDFGGVVRSTCGADFNRDGMFDQSDLREVNFEDCVLDFGDEVFSSDACKAFDYDNDLDIDDDDRCVFCCLSAECDPDAACVMGRTDGQCCANMVDNGFVAIVFGGRFIDGDRNIDQIATSDLPGTIFYGGHALDRAGMDVASAGDFNHDGFGDILIAVPGEKRTDSAGRERVGVVYLVFGGTHLTNRTFELSDLAHGVGSDDLPGIVFLSPYVTGSPNEAAPVTVGGIGDINNDGFDDIFIGNPKADFIDQTFPQGPNAPGSDAAAGRRRNAGDAYVIYGNNFGGNRLNP